MHLYPPVPAPQKFIYGTSDPLSPSHDSSEESVTSKGNPTSRNNPPNPVPNAPADPDPDPSSSDSSSSDSSESSYDKYYKKRQRTKKNKNKLRSKNSPNDPIKDCAKITAKLLTAVYKPKIINFKLDEYPLQRRFYLLSFMNLLKFVLSQFKETYMLITENPSIRGEDLPDYSKKATWKLLYAHIYEHIQRLIDEYTGDGV